MLKKLVSAFNKETKTFNWQISLEDDINYVRQVKYYNGNLYVGGGEGPLDYFAGTSTEIHSINAADGSKNWSTNLEYKGTIISIIEGGEPND